MRSLCGHTHVAPLGIFCVYGIHVSAHTRLVLVNVWAELAVFLAKTLLPLTRVLPLSLNSLEEQ